MLQLFPYSHVCHPPNNEVFISYVENRQTDLWGEVQSKITTLTDQMLEESFEVTVTKAKLKEDEKQLNDVLFKFKQQEDIFRDAANAFSRPIW